MTSLGLVRYMRARYCRDGESCALVPVDNSLELVEDYMTRPAAYLAVTMMGHCTAREAESFFARMGGMTPSISTLQRVTMALHKDFEKLGNPLLRALHASSAILPAAVVAAVSLDGIMVPLRPGEDGRKDAAWREASCGTVSVHDADGERLHTIYPGRMPETGKVSLKAEILAEVAHIQAVRPDIKILAIADAALNNWGFLETLSPTSCRRSISGTLVSISKQPPTIRCPATGTNDTATSCATTPTGSRRSSGPYVISATKRQREMTISSGS